MSISSSAHRFADRDMLMRYYWGFSIGHLYTHGQTAVKHSAELEATECAAGEETLEGATENPYEDGAGAGQRIDDNDSNVDQEDLVLGDCEDDGREDAANEFGEESDDEHFIAMDEMYGSSADYS
jgi:hypothetical protein